jgi:hypothetical protein
VVRRKERRENGHRAETVRPVLVVLPPLVQDHRALVRELGLGECGQQIAHAIGFHPQRELQRPGRNHFPVVGAVGVRGTVQRGAGALERLEVSVVVVRRSLEHQVLEQVGEAGVPRLLVLRSDVIPDIDRDNRTVVIFVEKNVEPVLERVAGIGQVHRKAPQVEDRS